MEGWEIPSSHGYLFSGIFPKRRRHEVASGKPATNVYQTPWGALRSHHLASFFNLIIQERILQSAKGKLSAFANVGPEDSKPGLWDRTCHNGHGYVWAASTSTAAHLCSSLIAKQSYWELCVLMELTLCPSTRKSLLRSCSLGHGMGQQPTKIKIQAQQLKGQRL